MFIYRLFRFFAFPFIWAGIYFRTRKMPDIRHERMGRPTENRPRGDIAWIVCADPGDGAEIIRDLLANTPNKTILLTYSAGPADGRLPSAPNVIRQRAPLDSWLVMRRFLRFWEPALAIWVRGGIKPNQLASLKKMGIPSFMINGEASDKSYRRWKWTKRLARRSMRNFTFIWALDDFQTLRLANMGARDIKSMNLMPGNNKIRDILYKIRQMIKD